MSHDDNFSFEISLSVLNHLGRNLYRSFATVLGEAISNAWDADADNVRIYIDKKANSFFIKDDGDGMASEEFQNRFLKIGYSKRRDGVTATGKGRPFIGRKGIGKLALLSCAEKITVITKQLGGEYVGGVIDNTDLDHAIIEDLTPTQYQLGNWSEDVFAPYLDGHEKGTIIYFENIKDGIKNSLEFLKKTVALYFKFSLIDPSFSIYLDDELVDHSALDDLATKTQFLWTINGHGDAYLTSLLEKFTDKNNESRDIKLDAEISGYVASVVKPRDLTITGTGERVGVDLFVNGRMRERDIIKHVPTSRVTENYVYGQIHFNQLDDEKDRFTSSREGIVADDEKFREFLGMFRQDVLLKIIEEWDEWRRKHRDEGDPENPAITPKARKSRDLYNVVTADYKLPDDSEEADKVAGWVDSLADDAEFNFGSYAECFISENLVRNFIDDRKLELSAEAKQQAADWRERENKSKEAGNVSIDIRQRDSDIGYLSMTELANFVDKKDKAKEASLSRDAAEYKPVRDAVAHTALLTDVGKDKLTSVYENIKARVRNLLAGQDEPEGE